MKSFLLEENWSRLWASSIIDQLCKHGLTQFYVSPGMRNAPFLATLSHAKAKSDTVKCHVGVDERAHAYRALGFAKASSQAAVLICTSGTAGANYLPAVIEAYESQVPLLIITSDRPPDVVMQQDNQTIGQHGLYSHFVQYERHFPTPRKSEDWLLLGQLIAQAVFDLKKQKRPIHFNIALEAPLDMESVEIPLSVLQMARSMALKTTASHVWQESKFDDTPLAKELVNAISKAKNPLLVFGEMPLISEMLKQGNFEEISNLISSVKKHSVDVFCDVGSSLKYQFAINDHMLASPDHPEALELWRSKQHDLIIHIGGRTVSKNYYSFLQSLPTECELYHLNSKGEIEDPSGRFHKRYKIELRSFLKSFSHELNSLPALEKGKEKTAWKKLEEFKREIIDSSPMTYPQVSKTVIESLPACTLLFLGNSTVARTFDSYIHFDRNQMLLVSTQRGVSGIEGCLSTALGMRDATLDNIPMMAVIGDIAMIHDLNALLDFSKSHKNLVLVIVNNFSGGIFNLLPVAKETSIMPYLTTPHQWQFAPMAKAIGLPHIQVEDADSLSKAVTMSMQNSGPFLIEVLINDKDNQDVYSKLRTVRL